MRFKKALQGVIYRLLCPLLAAVLLLSLPGLRQIAPASDTASTAPAWAAPQDVALKRIGDINSVRHNPVYFSNLDCTTLTYRLVNTGFMQSGCFTSTAFGLYDTDSSRVIFNGTDEALPLAAYAPHEILAPWPSALNLLAIDPVDTGGAYLDMYNNPLSAMSDQRDYLSRLSGKQMVTPPETKLWLPGGHRLIVHGQSLAFSAHGSWMMAETIYGYFVRVNLSSLEAVPFGPAFYGQNNSEPADVQVAISGDGRFVAVSNGSAPAFRIYDLATCSGNTTSWQAENCQEHDYWPFASQRIASLKTIANLRFIDDGLLSFEAGSNDVAGAGVYEIAPTATIGHLTDYLGLGDSYTSGEGAFDYLNGTDTDDNTCHLSARSYPLLLSGDLFGGNGHSVACSGAVIADVDSNDDKYKGQAKGGGSLEDLESSQDGQLASILAGYEPGYVPQHLFAQHYQPRVMTVSVGGNDIGFGDILERCVMPHISRHVSDDTCYNTYEDRLEVVNLVNRTIPRWTDLYRQLRTDAPGSVIYAIGYPSIASDTGDCPTNVSLGKSELEFAEELIHYIDGAVQQAAAAAGVQYVDISQALDGHRLCEASGSSVAVNGITAGNDFGVLGIGLLGRESYHPNALGHELIEQSILRKTNNLTEVGDGSAGNNDSSTLLNAPTTNRTVNTILPVHVISDPNIKPGISVTLRLDGPSGGFRPNSSYDIRLDGPGGLIIASLVSDAEGNLDGTIAVPADTSSGFHTIDVTGTNQASEPIDASQPIYTQPNASQAGIKLSFRSLKSHSLLPGRNY